MRSLFLRIFVSFWIALTVMGAASTAIHAMVRPDTVSQRRQRFVRALLRAEGEHVAAHVQGDRRAAADAKLRAIETATEIRAFLVHDGDVVAGTGPVTAEVLAAARAAREHGRAEETVSGPDDVYSVPVVQDGERYVFVGLLTRPSRWLRYVSPSTLPWRVLVVFVMSGLVALALARYLTKPLAHLRVAARRLADGDMSVRVTPTIGRAGGEVAALGEDFDRMAERIAALLETQRRLLQDVSHELRSPLARLSVALELARSRAGDDAKAHLDRIELETERLGDLIGQILAVTRLEQEHGVPGEPVDLEAITRSVVENADYEARARGRRVELAASAAGQVHGSAEVIARALENVVRNAARFTAEQTAVEVRIERVARESAPMLRVTVRDHGPGVPEHALRDIFLPFYRVATARERESGGTGLGLAITDRAVRAHGGTASASNAPGGGLLVTIELPAT